MHISARCSLLQTTLNAVLPNKMGRPVKPIMKIMATQGLTLTTETTTTDTTTTGTTTTATTTTDTTMDTTTTTTAITMGATITTIRPPISTSTANPSAWDVVNQLRHLVSVYLLIVISTFFLFYRADLNYAFLQKATKK